MTRHGQKPLSSELNCTRTIACRLCGAVFQGKPDAVNRQVSLHDKANHAAVREGAKLSLEEVAALTVPRLRARQHVEEVTVNTIFANTNSSALPLH